MRVSARQWVAKLLTGVVGKLRQQRQAATGDAKKKIPERPSHGGILPADAVEAHANLPSEEELLEVPAGQWPRDHFVFVTDVGSSFTSLGNYVKGNLKCEAKVKG